MRSRNQLISALRKSVHEHFEIITESGAAYSLQRAKEQKVRLLINLNNLERSCFHISQKTKSSSPVPFKLLSVRLDVTKVYKLIERPVEVVTPIGVPL